MAKHKEEKTNVMRVLDQKKIPYTAHTYDPESGIDGVSVARSLGRIRHRCSKRWWPVGPAAVITCSISPWPPRWT